MWSQAKNLALQAPPERNRYVDFLRALSILAVVSGHWLVAAPYIKDGAVVGGHLLGILPWTQWLTWGFQVMPLFFLVGGFSNGVSWAANRRDSGTFSGWYTGRLARLIWPVLPLFLIWTGFALTGTALGVEREIVKMAAQLALIPVWFLSVYLIVSALVPFSYAAWKRWGMASFWALVAGAVAVDLAAIRFAVPYVNFLNFLFVWLAVHQLGYAWAERCFVSRARCAVLALGGLTALVGLIGWGPYPVAMIGVPGSELSNSMPPTLALLALSAAQVGLALLLEPWGKRMLANLAAWTAVVLVNGMIMTLYLWHLTAFVAVIAVAWALGGIGLTAAPGSADWWLVRPLWFALYLAVSLPLVALLARYEQAGRSGGGGDVPPWRLVLGLVLICAGLAATAAISIASPLGITGVRLWVVALPFIGAALCGFGPLHSLVRQRI